MKKLSFFLYLTTLVFAPLAFGAAEQWALITVELLICFSVLFFILSNRLEKKKLFQVPGLLPISLLLLLMVIQIIPLPVFIVKYLSPSAYEVYRPIIEFTGSQFIPLSVHQKMTLEEFIRIGSFFLFYFLTVQILQDNSKLQITVKLVVYLAIGIAVIAILQKLSSTSQIYWFRPSPAGTNSMGPWVGRANYCGFMELLCPLILSLYFFYRPRVKYKETLRMKVVSFFSMPGMNNHLLLAVGFVLVCVSVFLSMSRGGIVSLCLALMLFIYMHSSRSKDTTLLSTSFIVGCVVLAVAWFGWQPILNRFKNTVVSVIDVKEGRFDLWGDTLELIKDYWATGSGFGTYMDIFPSYKTMADDLIYDHAHNEYLELLTDGGVAGIVFASWFVVAVVLKGLKILKKRRDNFAALVSFGVISGVVGFLVHCFADFNMHNGAVALYFFFSCGLIIAVSHTRVHYRSRTSYLSNASSLSSIYLTVFAIIFLVGTIIIQSGQLFSYSRYNSIRHLSLDRTSMKEHVETIKEVANTAAFLDPLNGSYPALLGLAELYSENKKLSMNHFVQAARLDPLRGVHFRQIGLLLTEDDKQLSNKFIQQGYNRELLKDKYVLFLAMRYLAADEREMAIGVLRERVAGNLQLLLTFTPVLDKYLFTREEIASILPETTYSWYKYGVFLSRKYKRLEDAEYYLKRVLDFLDQEEEILPQYFDGLIRIYRQQGEEEKAVDVIRKGIQYLPSYSHNYMLLGDYYMKKNIYYRAEEEYRYALQLEPNNKIYKARLRRLLIKAGE